MKHTYTFSSSGDGFFIRYSDDDNPEIIGKLTQNYPINKEIIYFLEGNIMFFLGNAYWGETCQTLLNNKEFENRDRGIDYLRSREFNVSVQDRYIKILDKDNREPCTLEEHGYDFDKLWTGYNGELDGDKFTLIKVDGEDTILFNRDTSRKSIYLLNGFYLGEHYESTLHVWSRLFYGKTVMDNSFDIV